MHEKIYDRYHIYWPESIRLEEKYPSLLRDFFQYDFDFLAVEKNKLDPITLPWRPLKTAIQVPQSVQQELLENIDYLRTGAMLHKQVEGALDPYGKISLDKKNSWSLSFLKTHKSSDMINLLDPGKLPQVTAFIKQLEVDVEYAFVGVLLPGEYGLPHIDSRSYQAESGFLGCTQIYIPIVWPDGDCFTKISAVGIVPKDGCMINIQQYVHALVNDTDSPRIILAIGTNHKKNPYA